MSEVIKKFLFDWVEKDPDNPGLYCCKHCHRKTHYEYYDETGWECMHARGCVGAKDTKYPPNQG